MSPRCSGSCSGTIRSSWRHSSFTSRAEFERLAAANPDTLTDLERAARFLYLQRLAFGGKVAGRSFGVQTGGGSRFDVTKLGPLLEEIHDRLAGVAIECLPWAEFIDRYDARHAILSRSAVLGLGDGLRSRRVLANRFQPPGVRLSRISGRFMLSVNDVPQTREIFGRFAIEQVMTQYTVGGGKPSDVPEIVVTGPFSRAIAGDT
jgi:DNA adenine methylase